MAAADRQSMAAAGHCMLLLTLLCSPVTALEPLSTGAVILGTGSVLYGLYVALPGLKCYVSRCCGEERPFSAYALHNDLNEKLFGQHLAHNMVLRSLNVFMKNANPRKPLVMSFHGWTGTGKNYITSIVVKNIFKLGMASESVHFIVPSLHFPHDSQISLYKEFSMQLKSNTLFCFLDLKCTWGCRDAGVVWSGMKSTTAFQEQVPERVVYRNAFVPSWIYVLLRDSNGVEMVKKPHRYWKKEGSRKAIELGNLELRWLKCRWKNPQSGRPRIYNTSILPVHIRSSAESRSERKCLIATGRGGQVRTVTGHYLNPLGSPQFRAALHNDLNEKLFGQHLAHNMVLRSLNVFMKNANPRKPLVMSFHGWTGTGKNYLTSIVVKNIFKLGMASESVHFIVPSLHFPHDSQISLYKDQLKSWIQGNVSRCERSIFIFDEADKLHPGLLRVMQPFLDFNDHIDGVSYRRAIFIFISNAGGELINRKMVEIWKDKKKREELVYSDFEHVLSSELFNSNESGFWQSELIAKDLINIYVPFLPLEFIHVKNCVLAELKHRGLHEDETLAEKVAKDMDYFPKEKRIFSTKGCKTVVSKLDLHI
ncbi:torsin-1A-like isoform X1 [Pelobates cultripes]|uniref:Torsin-1A-like isoform X1 n=1 Tax=Pelobates cultripes TaxID=61616 RepID=A0AAD1WLK7_PELCU|nr:torsin-1A-like isoform X1 [Pelobates cultripes]